MILKNNKVYLIPTLIISLSLLIALTNQIYPPPKHSSLSSAHFLQLHQQICQLKPVLHNVKDQINVNDAFYNKSLYQQRFHSYSQQLYQTLKITHQLCLQYSIKKQQKQIQSQNLNKQQTKLIKQLHIYHLYQLQSQKNIQITKQNYIINISEQQIAIHIFSYKGYVYALQTLIQIIKQDLTIPYGIIQDQPLVQYRGIMIDTARHFIKVQTIAKLIKTMPVVKLNMLHWHLSDDQSFSLQLGSHPQVSKYGSLGKQMAYTSDDIKMLIKLAKQNAVQIIPEVNTPAGVRSWTLSPSWKDKGITLQCNKGINYFEQLDVSKKTTLQLVQSIVKQVDYLFVDSPYIHLGGLRINQKCWNTSAINNYKTIHNLKSFADLVNFWRFQVKQAMAPVRKVIHWQDETVQLQTGSNDVIQYFGNQNRTKLILQKSTSKIILSPRDILTLGTGLGGYLGQHDEQDIYHVWRKDIIKQFIVFPQGIDKNRILGAQVVLQGHNTNNNQFQNNIWMRAAAFAGKVWSEQQLSFEDLLAQLVSLQAKLTNMGIEVSPLTVEICYKSPRGCITNVKKIQKMIEIQRNQDLQLKRFN